MREVWLWESVAVFGYVYLYWAIIEHWKIAFELLCPLCFSLSLLCLMPLDYYTLWRIKLLFPVLTALFFGLALLVQALIFIIRRQIIVINYSTQQRRQYFAEVCLSIESYWSTVFRNCRTMFRYNLIQKLLKIEFALYRSWPQFANSEVKGECFVLLWGRSSRKWLQFMSKVGWFRCYR